MPANWPRLRVKAAQSTELLAALFAEPSVDDERLLWAYLETKAALAEAMQALALEQLSDPVGLMDKAKLAIERQMANAYADLLPAQYLHVSGFGRVHETLLAYLARRVGRDVDAAELRVITADAVHTERRVRELRDLGLPIIAGHAGGRDTYVLESLEPDTSAAARELVRKNVLGDRRITVDAKAALLSAVGIEL